MTLTSVGLPGPSGKQDRGEQWPLDGPSDLAQWAPGTAEPFSKENIP